MSSTLNNDMFSILTVDTIQTRFKKARDLWEDKRKKRFFQSALVRYTGASRGTVSLWFEGNTQTISHDYLMLAAEFFDVDSEWLRSGKGLIEPAVKDEKSLPENTAETIYVPLLAVDGVLTGDQVVIKALPLAREFIDKYLGPITDTKNISFMPASGDLMAPTICHGDILLVDTGIKQVDAEGVFVVIAHDRLFIKRAWQRLDSSYFELSSDNTHVKTVDVLMEKKNVDIKGRVVWVWNGRKL